MAIGSAGFLLPANCPGTSSMFQLNPNFERCIFRCIFVFTRVHERYTTMSKTALHQLTRLEIVNAKAATRPYTLVDGGRLYVLVKPDGTKLWRWNTISPAKPKPWRSVDGLRSVRRRRGPHTPPDGSCYGWALTLWNAGGRQKPRHDSMSTQHSNRSRRHGSGSKSRIGP
jgi:hypothetical protein